MTLTNAECEFSYRKSIFNSSDRDRYVVCEVTFELHRSGPPRLVYKDLVEHFNGRTPSLGDVRDAVLAVRRSKSMVIDPKDPNSRSAGSFFKNPIISTDELNKLNKRFEDKVPSYRAGPNLHKIPAAWLIDNAGFPKGFRLGRGHFGQPPARFSQRWWGNGLRDSGNLWRSSMLPSQTYFRSNFSLNPYSWVFLTKPSQKIVHVRRADV